MPTDKMHLKLDISVLEFLYTIGIYGNCSRVTAYLVEMKRIDKNMNEKSVEHKESLVLLAPSIHLKKDYCNT